MEDNAVLEAGAGQEESTVETNTGETMNGLESLKFKTESPTTSSNDNTDEVANEENTDTESKTVDKKDKGDGDKKDGEESVVDPEVLEFIKEQKLDLGDLASNEQVIGLVNSLRDSKAENAKIQNQHQLDKDAMERRKAEENVDKVLDANKQDAPVPLSPIKQAEETYVNTVEGIMSILKQESVEDFANAYPDLFDGLKAAYGESKDLALTQEYEWHRKQETEAKAREDAQKAIETEYAGVKTKAADMITEAKKDYPEIAEDFEKYGVSEFIDTYSKLSGVPNEYYISDKPFFDFVSKAARNARIVEGMPEMESKIKNNVEKAINKTKRAETVSSDDPLPDDHTAAVRNFKASFSKQPGRGVKAY